MGLKLVKGLVWPAEDERCCAVAFDEVFKLDMVYPYVTDWSAAVQAGGNCGLWPMALATKFTNVYTFEPDSENFTCLAHNVHEHANVYRFQCALGDHKQTPIELKRIANNCGAHQVDGNGAIPVLALDAFNLPSCGLLYLDIEGFENKALKGAVDTILRCRPVIGLEMKNIGNLYGMPDDELEVWLTVGLRYRLALHLGKDRLYVPLP